MNLAYFSSVVNSVIMTSFTELMDRLPERLKEETLWCDGFAEGIKETLETPQTFDMEKCFDLVWICRRTRQQYVDKIEDPTTSAGSRKCYQDGLIAIDRIHDKYPEEIEWLSEDITGDLYCGVWNGRLATLRYLEDPDSNWPDLDS